MYSPRPGGKLKTSTSTPRRRTSSIWSRTQRPRCGRRVVGLEVGDDEDAHPGQGIRGRPRRASRSRRFGSLASRTCAHSGLDRCASAAEHWPPTERGGFDDLRADGVPARRDRAAGAPIRTLAASEAGQGTVEYVGLILLVSLLMVGMVAAMKGFNGKQGTELADVIVNKIKEAVDKVAFK